MKLPKAWVCKTPVIVTDPPSSQQILQRTEAITHLPRNLQASTPLHILSLSCDSTILGPNLPGYYCSDSAEPLALRRGCSTFQAETILSYCLPPTALVQAVLLGSVRYFMICTLSSLLRALALAVTSAWNTLLFDICPTHSFSFTQ